MVEDENFEGKLCTPLDLTLLAKTAQLSGNSSSLRSQSDLAL
jgi:hypothetical protein